MKRLVAIIMSVLLLASCELIFGPSSNKSGNNNNGNTSTGETINTAPAATTMSTRITANLAGARAVVSSQSSTKARTIGRGLDAASALSVILDSGDVTSLLNVPVGVTLPEVQFVKISPIDLSVYVLFSSPVVIPGQTATDPATTFAFIRLDPASASGGIEIIESANSFAKVSTDGYGARQEPIVFTDDGSAYYLTTDGTKQTLKRYASGMSSTISAAIPMKVSRFFSNGAQVFYLGSGTADSSVSLKMYEPTSAQTKNVFSSQTGTWIKDCYLQGTSLILSGYNIPDPAVQTRVYGGILKLDYDATAGTFTWQQIYGNASDSANSGWTANRRQLKASYFKKADGTFNTPLLQNTLAPFFAGGTTPDDLKAFAVVDIDKVSLDATKVPSGIVPKLEHKFWFGLLSGATGFDADYFYNVFLTLGSPDSTYGNASTVSNSVITLPTIVYPFTGSALLPTWTFDFLFNPSATSTYSYNGTITAYETAMKTATLTYFSALAMKSGKDPRVYQFNDLATDLSGFKSWLDGNFTYTWASGNALFNASTGSVKWTNAVGDTPLALVYYSMETAYGSPVKVVNFKSGVLGSDPTAAQAHVLAMVNKFYPTATLATGLDVNQGISVASTWSNSDAGKAAMLAQAFTLGAARVAAADATWVPAGLSKFYEYTTNQGIVGDPYFKNNLGTLFDTFNNLDRFALADDGSLYGVFRKLNSTVATSKVVRLMDGTTGDITGNIIYDDIASIDVKILDHYAYYLTRDSATDVSTLLRVDLTAATPTPETIVDKTQGVTIHDFNLASLGSVTNVLFTAVDPTTSRTKVGQVKAGAAVATSSAGTTTGTTSSTTTNGTASTTGAAGPVVMKDWGNGKPSDTAVAVVGEKKKK